MLAHISGEQVLKDIFERGEDVHAATAGEMFGVAPEQIDPGMRSKAKMINFGIVYGLSAYGLADRLDIPQEEAAEFIERYQARFPKVDGVHREDDRGGHRDRLRDHPARPQAPHPGAALAQVADAHARRAAGREHADPGHLGRHHQDRDGERAAGARGRRAAHAPRAPDPRRAAVRGAEAEEVEAATEIVVREMAEAYDLDPPLGVDAGAGDNWLAAK